MLSCTDECDETYGGCNTVSGREGWREREEGERGGRECGETEKGREGRECKNDPI